jgi:hypothetical protein
MIDRIFPRQFDNRYRGNRFAIWLFVPVVLIESLIGANSTFNARSVATGADGIPIDSFGAGGAQAVIAIFSLLGLCRLLFALQGILVLIRYRAMIPFMYLLLLILQLGSKALLLVNPIARSRDPSTQTGSVVILALLAMLLIGFVLSLLNQNDAPDSPN